MKRLGVGSEGSENDFRALKAHPFFKGIDFDNLANIEPPIETSCFNFSPQIVFEKSNDNSLSSLKSSNVSSKSTPPIHKLNNYQEISPFKIIQNEDDHKGDELILECIFLLL